MNQPSISRSQRAELATAILRSLSAAEPMIDSCAVVTVDGHVVASVLQSGADADRVAAMCASLIALAGRAADEIRRGRMRQLILEGENGTMLLLRAGTIGVLVVGAAPDIRLGKLIYDTHATAQRLAPLMSG